MAKQLVTYRSKPRFWRRAAPWIVSASSAVYTLVRVRRISRAEPTTDTIARFLFSQSDVVVLMCGSAVVVYRLGSSLHRHMDPYARELLLTGFVHQTRQILSVLLLGLGMLERRLQRGSYADMGGLINRLKEVIRQGTAAIEAIEQQTNALPTLPTK